MLRSPLHVGERGIGLEESLDHMPGDSLFSAMVVAWSQLDTARAAVDDLAVAFAHDPPLIMTSALPFVDEVLFFPKPLLGLTPDTNDNESAKRFKRVRWVSERIFKSLCAKPTQANLDALWNEALASMDAKNTNGSPNKASEYDDTMPKLLVQAGAVWLTAEERTQPAFVEVAALTEGALWNSHRVPKVALDRTTSQGALFHVGRMHFAPKSGLWVVAHGEAAWLDRMHAALEILQDQGLGGQRSRGNGQFSLEMLAPPLTPADDTDAYGLLLSRCAPRLAEMDLLRKPHAAYDLELLGGFNGTPSDPAVVRKQVRLLSAGSVIGLAGRAPGQLLDLTPVNWFSHPIYRYAYGFPYPVAFSSGEGA
jgi:CRISPR-associated protein Csm4